MAKVIFTRNIQRQVSCQSVDVSGSTVREVLEAVFALNQPVRSYVLDDSHALRSHMAVFVDGHPIRDRERLSDVIAPDSEVYVAQSLCGR